MEFLNVVKDFLLSIPSRVDITSPSTWAGIGVAIVGILILSLGNIALGLLTIIAGTLSIFLIEKNKSKK